MRLVCPEADRDHLDEFEDLFDVVGPGELTGGEGSAGEFFLSLEAGVLKLCRVGDRGGVFVEPAEIDKRARGDFLLGRACGVRRENGPRILDATAGLGVDALALAKRGAHVHMVERNPALWALLANLLVRSNISAAVLSLADSQEILDTEAPYDVVYFDPMFGPRSKSALPGKRMQYVGALLQDEHTSGGAMDVELIQQAQLCASSRVVLKRRAKDPLVGVPDWTIRGRSVRYDVYQGRADSR